MKIKPTPVIFRTFIKGCGEVIALFPFEPATNDGWYCNSYVHVGQHGSADPHICRRPITRPSTPAEIRPLARELRNYGPPEAHYRLKILRRVPRNALAVRRRNIAAMDGKAAV